VELHRGGGPAGGYAIHPAQATRGGWRRTTAGRRRLSLARGSGVTRGAGR
jgi:hypothetical protein